MKANVYHPRIWAYLSPQFKRHLTPVSKRSCFLTYTLFTWLTCTCLPALWHASKNSSVCFRFNFNFSFSFNLSLRFSVSFTTPNWNQQKLPAPHCLLAQIKRAQLEFVNWNFSPRLAQQVSPNESWSIRHQSRQRWERESCIINWAVLLCSI